MSVKTFITDKESQSGSFHNEKFLAVEFSDNGCGMSEEVKRKIFEPFFTTKDVGQGIGMGMSISYGIINEHQGKIEINSESEKGSVITVFLPINLKPGNE